MDNFDVVIIGAGVTGSSIARELSRRSGKFLVIDRAADVCEGTSKANSAIVHAGFDAEPNTMKAKMNVRGNVLMDEVSAQLDVPFKRVGAMVVCLNEDELPHLQQLYQRGITNGVTGLKLLSGEEARELEPNLSQKCCGALLAETSGIVCPFELTLGMAENAATNGVQFSFETKVTGIEKGENGWIITTEDGGEIHTRAVVNAAGVYADELHNMVCDEKLHITPRRGEYMLLDKTAGSHVSRTVFQLPGKLGKGVLVSPTVHGNLLVGPTAADTDDRESLATTAAGMGEVAAKSGLAVENVPLRQVITSFAGLRAHEDGDDFVLGEVADGFFDAAGIESPGLTAAPAIGEYIAELVAGELKLQPNASFNPIRKGVPHLAAMNAEERAEKIRENPAYGAIVCRCEQVSEGEIVDAIHGTIGAKTLDGVKRRTRAGMGRCQSGFCSPRIMELISQELGVDMREVCKNGKGSAVVVDKIR